MKEIDETNKDMNPKQSHESKINLTKEIYK